MQDKEIVPLFTWKQEHKCTDCEDNEELKALEQKEKSVLYPILEKKTSVMVENWKIL